MPVSQAVNGYHSRRVKLAPGPIATASVSFAIESSLDTTSIGSVRPWFALAR